MDAVIGNEGENDEEIIANVITFSQLKSLHLDRLPHLISFYPRIKMATTIESHSFPPTQSLFNEKVAFPVLEELNINSVQNITEIWHKKLPPAESFCRLKYLEVLNCEKLMNVVPPNMLPQLKSIETLEISRCPEMEVIVVFEKREEETTQEANNKDMIIVQFPQLRILKLYDLGRLSSFNNISTITETRPLFNSQVAFPALEELNINSVQNITEIWHKKLPPAESFCQLKSLEVLNCEKLMNMVPSNMLPQLKSIETLEISGCPEMVVIVVFEKREEEMTQEATNKDMIIMQFPQLRILKLFDLGRLSSFNNTSTITETRPLFNYQVAFPALEELIISSVPNITEIWDNNLLQPASFCLPRSLGIRGFEKLRSLEVKGCEKLMNVVPPHMLPLLKSIETLNVSECPKMEVIVVLEKKEKETQEATNKDIIMFPELTSLTLGELENLKGVCAHKFEDRLCFNVQVAFPSLEELSIYELPNITKIWDKNLLQPESFCLLRSSGVRGYEKLRFLAVRDCKKLMNVVPSHMLPLLKNIEMLEVKNCPEMEVIVVLEKREEETQEATNKDIILQFPKLWYLVLGELENLKGVCAYKSEDQLCFNVQVVFPKLRYRYLDEHSGKIFTEATSNKKECATMNASGSGMQLQQ